MKRIFVLITLLLITIAGCINVTQPPTPVVTLPAIVAFSASPTEMKAGESATLLWNVTGATSVIIDQGVGKVDVAGTKAVSPTKTTIYTLTATNSAGTNSQPVTLTIGGISIMPGLERRQFPPITLLTETVFDFMDEAPNAAWRNSKGAVTSGYGFQIVDDKMFGDGVKYPKTLIISCNQYPDFIQGTYPEITIPTGAHFVAKMSTPKGMQEFDDYCISFIRNPGGYEIPLQCQKLPNGGLYAFDIDLVSIAGKTGRISIRAATAPGAYQTLYSQWIDIKIIR